MNEEFDKWWKESVYMDGDCAYDAAKAAYTAGLQRAAEIVNRSVLVTDIETRIAAAIQKIKVA